LIKEILRGIYAKAESQAEIYLNIRKIAATTYIEKLCDRRWNIYQLTVLQIAFALQSVQQHDLPLSPLHMDIDGQVVNLAPLSYPYTTRLSAIAETAAPSTAAEYCRTSALGFAATA